uniref:Odorant-binding protein 11 n=1 Tax=Streltzoviella insularis TaxID=1206366 RepID=A0A7D5UMK9_9NEOP|nr:odorant-binding protein 11 [Streltzoviella insularis]
MPPLVTSLALLVIIVSVHQATLGCKNCIILGKEEKAMFRVHSDACQAQSQVDSKLLESLLNGELIDDPGLRKHVYCVLLKCKMIGKDGKLQKAAILGKMAPRVDGRNATKVLESCSEQKGDSPEDVAWNLFRCGYDKKALLFDYMPSGGGGDIDNNSN